MITTNLLLLIIGAGLIIDVTAAIDGCFEEIETDDPRLISAINQVLNSDDEPKYLNKVVSARYQEPDVFDLFLVVTNTNTYTTSFWRAQCKLEAPNEIITLLFKKSEYIRPNSYS